MSPPGQSRDRFVALFLLGVLLFAPPFLLVFNSGTRLLGVPALYLYLFAAWTLLIALAAVAVRRAAADDDLAGPARAAPGGASPPAAGGRTDA